MCDQTKAVVSARAVAGFTSLLGSPHPVMVEHDVYAGDEPEPRDHVIEQGIIKFLLHQPDILQSIDCLFPILSKALCNILFLVYC